MNKDEGREIVTRLVEQSRKSLAEVSRAIGKNHAYLQQYITRQSPRRLPEDVREALGAYFGVNPDIFRGSSRGLAPKKAEGGFPVLYRVASAFSGISCLDIPPEERSYLQPPPRWKESADCFVAEICDDSADRAYPAGSLVICASPDNLGRRLHEGDHCLTRHFRKNRRDGAVLEMLMMSVSLSADGLDIVFTALTGNREKRQTFSLFRGEFSKGFAFQGGRFRGEGGPAEIPYKPQADDICEIIGVKVGALLP